MTALTVTQVQALTNTTARAHDVDADHRVAKRADGFRRNRISPLAYQTALTDAGHMATSVIASLTTTDVAGLSTAQILALTSTQVGDFSTDQIGVLTATQLGVLTSVQLTGLSTTDIATLSTTQLAGVSSVQVSELDDDADQRSHDDGYRGSDGNAVGAVCPWLRLAV